MSLPIFWIFATLMLASGIAVIAFRNPVSSALSVVVSFVGLAGLFISLSAFFVGIIQILVYAGAVMVLFLFIIMLLDLDDEGKRVRRMMPIAAGLGLAVMFVIQLVEVLSSRPPNQVMPPITQASLATSAASFHPESKIAEALSQGTLPDVQLIGHTLFTTHNFPLQILGVLLLVATVGVVVLSKKQLEPKNRSN